MGRKPTGDRKYEIQHMWDKHHEITRLLFLGWDNVEIADQLRMTPQQISNIRNSTIIKDKMSIMQAQADTGAIDVKQAIQEFAPDCLQVVKDLVGDKTTPHGVRANLCKDMLDRAGHAAPKVIEQKIVHAVLSRDDIEEIKQRALAMQGGVDNPIIINE